MCEHILSKGQYKGFTCGATKSSESYCVQHRYKEGKDTCNWVMPHGGECAFTVQPGESRCKYHKKFINECAHAFYKGKHKHEYCKNGVVVGEHFCHIHRNEVYNHCSECKYITDNGDLCGVKTFAPDGLCGKHQKRRHNVSRDDEIDERIERIKHVLEAQRKHNIKLMAENNTGELFPKLLEKLDDKLEQVNFVLE